MLAIFVWTICFFPDEPTSGGRRASVFESEEVYSGLRAQDLQEAKDQGSIQQNIQIFPNFDKNYPGKRK